MFIINVLFSLMYILSFVCTPSPLSVVSLPILAWIPKHLQSRRVRVPYFLYLRDIGSRRNSFLSLWPWVWFLENYHMNLLFFSQFNGVSTLNAHVVHAGFPGFQNMWNICSFLKYIMWIVLAWTLSALTHCYEVMGEQEVNYWIAN